MRETARVLELRELITARAPSEGRTGSAWPGLWFFRFSRPMPAKQSRSTTMYLGVALQGRKLVQVADQRWVYDELNYLVLRGDTSYRAAPTAASKRAPYLAMGIQLPPELVLRTLLDLSEEGQEAPPQSETKAPAPAAFVSPLDAHLVDALARLIRAVDDPRERRVLAPLILREIVFRLLCTDAAALLRQAVRGPAERDRIRRAMQFIESRFEQRLSVEEVARRVAMSPSHFAHRFKDVASVSPLQYQKHLRLERARELLLAQREPAAQIAASVGYASPAHFTRDFKREFGLSPARYARAFESGSIAQLHDASAGE